MALWKWLLGSLDDNTKALSTPAPAEICSAVNPATGLPMLSGGISSLDAGGSPFGKDLHSSASWGSSTSCGTEIGSAMP